ncbi:hypothetical protein RA210_U700002 [Rubrivivax sp. A210]|nr:hypothetical protein RA210_U700002 [Rubrivivax sp. A210]
MAAAWRFTAGASLAPTLGSEGTALQCSSRVSALRRELSSHDAASREHRARRQARRDSGTTTTMPGLGEDKFQQVQRINSGRELNTNDREPLCLIEPLHCVGALDFQSVSRAAAGGVCESFIGQPARRLEFVVRHGLQRGPARLCGSPSNDNKVAPLTSRRASLPNPSLKWSANGLPPGPGCGALHSPQPGPGGKPSSPT